MPDEYYLDMWQGSKYTLYDQLLDDDDLAYWEMRNSQGRQARLKKRAARIQKYMAF